MLLFYSSICTEVWIWGVLAQIKGGGQRKKYWGRVADWIWGMRREVENGTQILTLGDREGAGPSPEVRQSNPKSNPRVTVHWGGGTCQV